MWENKVCCNLGVSFFSNRIPLGCTAVGVRMLWNHLARTSNGIHVKCEYTRMLQQHRNYCWKVYTQTWQMRITCLANWFGKIQKSEQFFISMESIFWWMEELCANSLKIAWQCWCFRSFEFHLWFAYASDALSFSSIHLTDVGSSYISHFLRIFFCMSFFVHNIRIFTSGLGRLQTREHLFMYAHILIQFLFIEQFHREFYSHFFLSLSFAMSYCAWLELWT